MRLNINMKMIIGYYCLTFFAIDSNAQTTINAGAVSGKWIKAKSPYYIKGNITVPKDSVLIIESGVKIRFDGKFMIAVYGKINAMGKQSDSISFYPQDTLNRWRGIRFFGTKQLKDSATFSYCIFERAGPKLTKTESVLYLTRGHFIVSNCVFRFNNGFQRPNCILGDSLLSLKISNCYFYRNFSINSDPSYSSFGNGAVVGVTNGLVDNCIFEGNVLKNPYFSQDAYSVDGSGGTLSVSDIVEKNMNVTISNCRFLKNVTGSHSSAISPYPWNKGSK